VIIPFFVLFCQKSFLWCVLSKVFYIMAADLYILLEQNYQIFDKLHCQKKEFRQVWYRSISLINWVLCVMEGVSIFIPASAAAVTQMLSPTKPASTRNFIFLSLTIELTVCHRRISECCWPAAKQTCHLVKIFLYPQWRTCLVLRGMYSVSSCKECGHFIHQPLTCFTNNGMYGDLGGRNEQVITHLPYTFCSAFIEKVATFAFLIGLSSLKSLDVSIFIRNSFCKTCLVRVHCIILQSYSYVQNYSEKCA